MLDHGLAAGLPVLVAELRSLALPALGCGLGGLAWADVSLRIVAAFAKLPDIRALLFAPDSAPRPAR